MSPMDFIVAFITASVVIGFVAVTAIYLREACWEQEQARRYYEQEARRNGWTVIENDWVDLSKVGEGKDDSLDLSEGVACDE